MNRCRLPLLGWLTWLLAVSGSLQAQYPSTSFHPLQIHTDKQFFLPGEPVFFTVFKVTQDSLPVRGCVVALVDESGVVLATRRLLLTDEPAPGYFILPSSVAAAFYSLQCRWDNGEDSPITGALLMAALHPVTPPASRSSYPPEIRPESGSQPSDSTGVFYFRVPGWTASDRPVRYALLNQAGDTLLFDYTSSSGAGRFEWPGGVPETCFLVYEAGGVQYRWPVRNIGTLPAHATLNVYSVPGARVGRLRVKLPGSYTLELSQEGTVYYRGTVQLQSGDDFSKTFPEEQIRKGLNYLRLYNGENRLLGERLIFRRQSEPVPVRSAKRVRADKIRLQLEQDLKGVFSVAVFPVTARHLPVNHTDDTVLQTSGWQGKEPMLRGPDSIELQVQETGQPGWYAGKDIKIFIRTPQYDRVLELTTDEQGKVKLDRTIIEDSATILVLPRMKKSSQPQLLTVEKPAVFRADSSFIQSLLPEQAAPATDNITLQEANESFTRYQAKWLKEVFVKSRSKSRMESVEDTYATAMYRSKVNQVAAFDLTSGYDNELMGSLLTFLQGRIPPVKNTSVTSGTATDGYNYYVNESLVDRSVANSIPLSDIAYISVMGRNFVPVTGEMGPAILIYTRKGRDRFQAAGDYERNQLLTVQGYATAEKYFNPLFDEGMLPGSLRTTLYWNHRLRLKGVQQLDIELFEAHRGPVLLSMRGFDEKGNFRQQDMVIE